MERTEPLPASGASPFQLHIPPDDVHDVRTIADIVNFFAWQQRQIETCAPEEAAGLISSQPALVKGIWGTKRNLLDSLVISTSYTGYMNKIGERTEPPRAADSLSSR